MNKHTFKRLVERLGFTLTEDQAKGLFRKIDADNSGGITLTEFLRGVIPKDSSGNSWHDKRRDQEAASPPLSGDNGGGEGSTSPEPPSGASELYKKLAAHHMKPWKPHQQETLDFLSLLPPLL